MSDLLTKLLAEWRLIANAPQTFVISLLLGFAIIWLLMEWQYRTIIKRKQSHIDLLRAQNSQARSKSLPDTDDRRIIERLASLIDEGQNIQRTFNQGGDTALIKRQFFEWADKTETFLREELGTAYATRFRAARGNPMMGSPHGRSEEGDGFWQTIGGKINVLANFLTELSGKR
jgi:hypothetical protein